MFEYFFWMRNLKNLISQKLYYNHTNFDNDRSKYFAVIIIYQYNNWVSFLHSTNKNSLRNVKKTEALFFFWKSLETKVFIINSIVTERFDAVRSRLPIILITARVTVVFTCRNE